MKLTKTVVESMELGEILWDDAVVGFGVRRQRGAPRYFVKYRTAENRQRWVTIGRHGSPWTVDTARKEALSIMGSVADHEDPAERRDFDGAIPSLSDFSKIYLERHARKHKAPRSVAEDERNLKLHVLPALGTLRVDAIKTIDVVKFHTERDHAPVNANRCLALISHMMRKAETWGLRPKFSNPCRDVERFDELARERYLSAAELARLGQAIAALEKAEAFSIFAIAALRILALTGARKSEIVTLRWEHVVMDRSVARRDTKTGVRNIHLPPPALTILKALPRIDGSPWVFPGSRDPSTPLGDLENAWRRARADAKLEGVRLHDLRHAFASVAASSGDSLLVIGAMLGHTNAVTTQRYAHLMADPVAGAAAATAKRIATAMKAKPAKDNVRRMPTRRRA